MLSEQLLRHGQASVAPSCAPLRSRSLLLYLHLPAQALAVPGEGRAHLAAPMVSCRGSSLAVDDGKTAAAVGEREGRATRKPCLASMPEEPLWRPRSVSDRRSAACVGCHFAPSRAPGAGTSQEACLLLENAGPCCLVIRRTFCADGGEEVGEQQIGSAAGKAAAGALPQAHAPASQTTRESHNIRQSARSLLLRLSACCAVILSHTACPSAATATRDGELFAPRACLRGGGAAQGASVA